MGDQPLSHPRADSLAKRFGVDRSTIYRYRNRLREVDETTAIAGRTRGWKPLASRLSAKQEEGIEEALNSFREKAGPIRLIDLVEEVEVRCRLLRVQCPSRPAIDRRLKRSHGLKVHRRGVAAPGSADPRVSPGSFVVERALDVVQIDHTPMDIVVVDDLYRRPLGKPYLTLATDVATRCILGFVISFVPPGAGTVSLCLTLIVSSKDAWLKQLGLVGDWPMAGLPKTLHLDGAAEFKSRALGDTKSFCRRVDGDDGRGHGSQELRPVSRAARDLQYALARQNRGQPLLDLAQIDLPLWLLVDSVVLASASGVIRLHRREATLQAGA